MATKTVERAMENMGHVRRLLGQKQPDSPHGLSWPRRSWSPTWDQGKELELRGHGR
jgi:hypothetical protein